MPATDRRAGGALVDAVVAVKALRVAMLRTGLMFVGAVNGYTDADIGTPTTYQWRSRVPFELYYDLDPINQMLVRLAPLVWALYWAWFASITLQPPDRLVVWVAAGYFGLNWLLLGVFDPLMWFWERLTGAAT